MPVGTMKKYKKPTKKLVTYQTMKSYVDRNLENKIAYGYLNSAFSSIGNTWIEVDMLNAISQGATFNTRQGNEVRIKSLQFRGVLVQGSVQSVADDISNVTRIVCCKARTNILNPLATASYTINSFILGTSGFTGLNKVYYDKLVCQSPVMASNTAGYIPSQRLIKFYKRFKTPWKVTWSSNGAGSNDYRLFLGMISDSLVVPNTGFVIGNWKVVFEDA